MKTHWLIKNNTGKIILFFNGWSMDENIVKHLTSSEHNVLMFYDYRSLEIDKDTLKEIADYKEINIIAWSFGVWACYSAIEKLQKANQIIAINGTPIPIDFKFGIPEKIFNLTLSTLSEESAITFYKNMFLDNQIGDGQGNRSLKDKKNELEKIKELSSKKYIQPNTKINKVFIGIKDKIIPAKNQLRFWSEEKVDSIIELDQGHCIFNIFNSWDEIINYA